jgi:hypothetical protein
MLLTQPSDYENSNTNIGISQPIVYKAMLLITTRFYGLRARYTQLTYFFKADYADSSNIAQR